MITRLLYRNYFATSSLRHALQRKFTPAGWLVLAGAFMSAGVGLDTSQALAYQGFALLSGVVLVSLLWTFAPAPRLKATRILPRIGTAGQPLPYKVVVINPGKRPEASITVFEDLGDPRPTFEQFRDNPEPGEKKRNAWDRFFRFYRWMWLVARNELAEGAEVKLPTLLPGKQVEVSAQVLPKKRGILRFSGFSFAGTDPFGLTRKWARTKVAQKVLILPKRYHVPEMVVPGRLEYQPGGVSLASSIGESGEFTALREYRRGDPLRHIHWKSVSKTGKLIVKEFQDEYFMRHALILDTFLKEVAGEENFEEAVSVAASFAHALNTQESLLDLLFVGPQAYSMTAGRGVGHVEQMLEILASVQACTTHGFDTLRELVLQRIELVSGAVCIFLEWDAPRKELIKQLKTRHIPVLIFVFWNGKGNKPEAGDTLEEEDGFHVLRAGQVEEVLGTL
jgi:uncharacterized protein (DUF58 family)